jgi:hypothetical protein
MLKNEALITTPARMMSTHRVASRRRATRVAPRAQYIDSAPSASSRALWSRYAAPTAPRSQPQPQERGVSLRSNGTAGCARTRHPQHPNNSACARSAGPPAAPPSASERAPGRVVLPGARRRLDSGRPSQRRARGRRGALEDAVGPDPLVARSLGERLTRVDVSRVPQHPAI